MVIAFLDTQIFRGAQKIKKKFLIFWKQGLEIRLVNFISVNTEALIDLSMLVPSDFENGIRRQNSYL